MLAGRPIVATTAGGIPDLVGRDEAGGRTGGVDGSAQRRAGIGRGDRTCDGLPRAVCGDAGRGRERALQRFTADCMVEATLAVYREGCATAVRK